MFVVSGFSVRASLIVLRRLLMVITRWTIIKFDAEVSIDIKLFVGSLFVAVDVKVEVLLTT